MSKRGEEEEGGGVGGSGDGDGREGVNSSRRIDRKEVEVSGSA